MWKSWKISEHKNIYICLFVCITKKYMIIIARGIRDEWKSIKYLYVFDLLSVASKKKKTKKKNLHIWML